MPVFVNVADPAWMQEVRMVVAVTGRILVPVTDEMEPPAEAGSACRTIGYLVADHATPWDGHPNLTVIRVDTCTPSLDAGGALTLAERIGADDRPLIAVTGAVGGAGTSLFAASIAHYLHAQGTPVLVVDADRDSAGVDVVYGVENQPGWRLGDLPEDATWEDVAANTPQLCDVDGAGIPVLAASWDVTASSRDSSGSTPGWGARVASVLRGTQRPATVMDCGRSLPDELGELGREIDLHVMVVPLTVPSIVAARDRIARIAAHGRTEPVVVVRDIPGSTTTVNLAATMLAMRPAARIPEDRNCLQAVETGQVSHWLTSTHHNGHPAAAAVMKAFDNARAELITDVLSSYTVARAG